MNESQWRAMFPRANRAIGLLLRCAFAFAFALAAPLARAESGRERRPLPDYDGRGSEPVTTGKVLLWAPRVVFFPLYVVSEYVVRRPLGWLITSAERANLPAAIYDFLTFGPDHKAGFVPVAFVEFGFRPSVGLYTFWDDAGFSGHALRLHVSTGGNNWFVGSFTEGFRLSPTSHLTLNVSGGRRPDYTFYGTGPLTSEGDRARYGADTFDTRATFDVGFWRSSRVESAVGFRSVGFRRGAYLGQPTVEDRVAEGAFTVPDAYADGYQAVFTRLAVALDSRRPHAASRSGVRLEAQAEQGTDLQQERPAGWVRFGGAAGGFLDLGSNGRVVSLSLAALFAEPLGPRPVPFTELATLGGPGLMPGFRTGRLRGQSAAVATLRYAWPIWVWLNGSLQTAVGNVFGEQLAGLRLSQMRVSAAIGVESEGSSESTLQLLFGFGTDTFDRGARIDSLRLTLGVRNGF
jgi:hypothetical protein